MQLESALKDLKESKHTSNHFTLAMSQLVRKSASMILLKNATVLKGLSGIQGVSVTTDKVEFDIVSEATENVHVKLINLTA
jgi:hypothetical protein